MPLRGVIFDMGGTLLTYHPPEADPRHGWEAMEALGADGLRAFLLSRGYAVPSVEEARARNFAVMDAGWRRLDSEPGANPQLGPLLREVLRDWGLPPAALADGLIAEAMDAYAGAVQRIVTPLEGAAETLAAVRARGLQVGLFSNTVWPGEYHRADLARWGLMPYLEAAFFSADVAAWKPDPAVFHMVLWTRWACARRKRSTSAITPMPMCGVRNRPGCAGYGCVARNGPGGILAVVRYCRMLHWSAYPICWQCWIAGCRDYRAYVVGFWHCVLCMKARSGAAIAGSGRWI